MHLTELVQLGLIGERAPSSKPLLELFSDLSAENAWDYLTGQGQHCAGEIHNGPRSLTFRHRTSMIRKQANGFRN
jgi:hypothetical protein